uniref:ATP receptor n=1 Tax=Varanus komodoensis TaxID=61221 RepID=A0A8D2L9V7_VARKO
MGQVAWKELCLSLFDYKTEKYVIAKNKKVGILYRAVQLFILAYIVGWVFMVKKGYQDVDTSIQSSVITKLKGVAFTNTSELSQKVWDVADYVIPSQVQTPTQFYAVLPSIPDALCYRDGDCASGEAVIAGNGVKTGRCLKAGANKSGTCEILAWCPVEKRGRPKLVVIFPTSNAENFTVYIKNSICFPRFHFCKTNVLETKDDTYLKTCRYGPEHPYCPIFLLGNLIHWKCASLPLKGGVIGIQISWNCDLDKAASQCNPQYSFSRLDSRLTEKSVSSGYNFRFAKYYRDAADVDFRTLIKAYGIRFDVIVNGKVMRAQWEAPRISQLCVLSVGLAL